MPPQLPFDTGTLIVATALANATGALLLYLLRPRDPSLAGAGLWSLGLGGAALGNGLIALRGSIPAALSVVAANAVIVLAVGLLWLGAARFVGHRERWGLVAALVALSVVVLVPLTYVWPLAWARVIAMAVAVGIPSIAAGGPLLASHHRSFHSAATVSGVLLAANGVVLLARIPGELLVWRTDVYLASWSGLLTYAWLLLFSVAIQAALLLTISQRLNEEMEALAEAIPICSGCKKMRDSEGGWDRLETFLRRHHQLEMTHGLCPDCLHRLYPDYAD